MRIRKYINSILATILVAVVVFFGLYAMGMADNDGVVKVDQMEYVSGGFAFSGELKNRQFSGDGTISFQDGSRYSGGFAAGRFDGIATFYNNSGAEDGEWRFDGVFQDGKASGGTFYLNDGVEITVDRSQTESTIKSPVWQYSGSFNERGQTGTGAFTFEDGSVYEGEFFCGLAHGQGVYTSNEGWSFKGAFKDGMFDGEGEIADGTSVNRGIWEEGVQVTRYE